MSVKKPKKETIKKLKHCKVKERSKNDIDQLALKESDTISKEKKQKKKKLLKNKRDLCDISVHVSPLPRDFKVSQIKVLSTVASCIRIPVHDKTKLARSYGFFQYEDNDTAQIELKKIAGRLFNGNILRANFSKPPLIDSMDQVDWLKLFVCGLAETVTLKDLKKLVPSADNISIHFDKSGVNYGSCFLSFVDPEVAFDVFKSLHNYDLKDSRLNVNYLIRFPQNVKKEEHTKKEEIKLLDKNKSNRTESDIPAKVTKCQSEIKADINRAALSAKRRLNTASENKVIIKALEDDSDESGDEEKVAEPTYSNDSCESDEDDVFQLNDEDKKMSQRFMLSDSIKTTANEADDKSDESEETNSSEDESSGNDPECDSEDDDESAENEEDEESEEEDAEKIENEKRIMDIMSLKNVGQTKVKGEKSRSDKLVNKQLSDVLSSIKKAKKAMKSGSTKRSWNVARSTKDKKGNPRKKQRFS